MICNLCKFIDVDFFSSHLCHCRKLSLTWELLVLKKGKDSKHTKWENNILLHLNGYLWAQILILLNILFWWATFWQSLTFHCEAQISLFGSDCWKKCGHRIWNMGCHLFSMLFSCELWPVLINHPVKMHFYVTHNAVKSSKTNRKPWETNAFKNKKNKCEKVMNCRNAIK